MCSCLTFLHVYLLNPRIGALSTLFSRSEYFVLLHYKQKIDVLLFVFFCFYPCVLFSQTRNLSTFFTVRILRSVTAYAGIGCFSMSIFFMFVYFFHVLVPCLPIFIERVLRSLTPYGKTLLFVMFTFFKDGTMSIIFTARIFRSITPKAGNLRVLQVYFFTPVYLFH